MRIAVRAGAVGASEAPGDDARQLACWEVFRDGLDVRAVAAAVLEGKLGRPALQVHPVANAGDTLTVHVAEGAAPEPGSLVYLERRGLYEVVRCERWPSGRELLQLEARPRR